MPESLRVAYQDVYNALRKRLADDARLDPDGNRSLELWATKLREQGYKVLYEQVSVQLAAEDSFIFALVSPWQQKVSRSIGSTDIY